MSDSSFSKEEKVLLSALGRFVGGALGGGEEPLSVPSWCDWGEVERLATFHRLTPILLPLLPRERVPAEVVTRMRNRARQRRIRVMVMSDAFSRLHGALRHAGIRAVPIKGMALVHHIYPSPTQRYFDDIDVLVPREALAPAAEVLEALGYDIHPNAGNPEWHHLAPRVHPTHGAVVEIHHDLLRRAGDEQWPLAEIWQRIRPAQVAGVESEILDDVDALVHTLLHARHSLFHRLSTLVDGLLLLGRLADAGRLTEAVDRVEAAGGRIPLAYLCSESSRLFEGEPAVEALLARGELPAGPRRPLSALRWNSLHPNTRPPHDGPIARLRELLLLDTPGAALALGRRLLFPPASFVDAGYGTGPGGYARRLWQRTRIAAAQIFQNRF
jgi:hypothetical protein